MRRTVIRLGEAGDPRKWRGAARGAEHFSPAYLVFVTPGGRSSRGASLRAGTSTRRTDDERARVNKENVWRDDVRRCIGSIYCTREASSARRSSQPRRNRSNSTKFRENCIYKFLCAPAALVESFAFPPRRRITRSRSSRFTAPPRATLDCQRNYNRRAYPAE